MIIEIIAIVTKTDNHLEETLSFGALFLKMIVALGIVCLLAYIIMKWALPKAVNLHAGHKNLIKIVDYFKLEPKKTLYIIEIEGKYLLLGVTDQYITPLTLAQLDEERIKKALSLQKEDVYLPKKFLWPQIFMREIKSKESNSE